MFTLEFLFFPKATLKPATLLPLHFPLCVASRHHHFKPVSTVGSRATRHHERALLIRSWISFQFTLTVRNVCVCLCFRARRFVSVVLFSQNASSIVSVSVFILVVVVVVFLCFASTPRLRPFFLNLASLDYIPTCNFIPAGEFLVIRDDGFTLY